jgi:signal peptidase II
LISSLFLASGLVIASDQMTKSYVQRSLPCGQRITVAPRINFRLSVSPRLGGVQPSRSLLFAMASALLFFATLLYLKESSLHRSVASFAFGAALGGAGSNLYSKLHNGYVIDFIEVLKIPLFNVADIAITLGSPFTAIVILRSLFNVH